MINDFIFSNTGVKADFWVTETTNVYSEKKKNKKKKIKKNKKKKKKKKKLGIFH